jgi:hypothetical protein
MLSWNCKKLQHVKIFEVNIFEVNITTHFGVIALFSSTCSKLWYLLQRYLLQRSSRAAIFCNFNLTSIFYRFWNKGRKLLKFRKFDEKRARESLNCKNVQHVKIYKKNSHCVKSYSSWNASFCWLTAFGYSNN